MSHTAPVGYTGVAPWVVTDDTGALLDDQVGAYGFPPFRLQDSANPRASRRPG